MLGYIWSGMILISIVCALCTGRMDALTRAISDGADSSVRLIISMTGSMCLWTGIMSIAQKSGAAARIAAVLSPVLKKLMPGLDPEGKAMQSVCANITANILGLGNAATPFGLKAMQEMQKDNPLKSQPTHDMIVFVVLNTASLQLIPATIAALRQAAGSNAPYSILPYIWITSVAALAVGLSLTKVFSRSRQLAPRR